MAVDEVTSDFLRPSTKCHGKLYETLSVRYRNGTKLVTSIQMVIISVREVVAQFKGP